MTAATGGELRLIVDQLVSPVPGGIGRYAAGLGRALVETAPARRGVVGVVSRVGREGIERVREAIPGLAGVDVLARPYRRLVLAWELGAVAAAELPAGSATHAASQLAPLVPARRGRGARVVATIHDTVPWTHPGTLTAFGAQWHRAMARRAARFADAIVVPSHAVAEELARHVNLGSGDRVHVIGGAPSAALALPPDADARAGTLGLPERYVLAVGTLEPRKGLDALVAAMADPAAPDVPLVVAGPPGWGGIDLAALAARTGLAPGRVRALGRIADTDLAVAYARAAAFCMPSRAEGFGLPVVEAMALGAPVVHSDVPALVEVAGGAGVAVPRDPAATHPSRLAAALREVVEDERRADALRAAGLARAARFSWRASAEAVWALHAALG